MSAGSARVYLANLVNTVMIEQPPPGYARAMAAVTPRKLWLAEPGDCVVTLAPCSGAFRDYVAGVTRTPPDSVDLIAPREVMPVHPADVVAERDALTRVGSRAVLVPFVLDPPALDLADRAGLSVHPYHRRPGPRTVEAVQVMNTKAGFRAVAAGLGLPVADGGFSATAADLTRDVVGFLRDHPNVIVKVNRSSNGHGTFVCEAGDGRAVIEQRIARSVAEAPARRCGWVYEEFLAFESMPSVELFVDDSGVHDFYTCDQRTRNNAWTGMVTPAAASPVLPRLADAAARIGAWLHTAGFRGYFDVDGGVVGSAYVVTEANVRRTGGTYLHQLASRLTPAGTTAHWRADVRAGATGMDFAAAVTAVRRAGLDDATAPARALLTVDTLAVDGKWRYFVVGGSDTAVAEAERILADVLGLE
ncbi:hypothetical protein Daura_28170 [Dactylosporangium aurantiacum]|uniref:ATP-grasp domain-containing protein n=1 Tax=Dactylosporangium aurantiacum TaxID=35754 RepID=A0A9Q9MDU9_9ACTN|nr:peptide ligase PGM1-related protein [Dactylosporangium aurantiacum]MDG6106945.1 peptide ligase PGM1-related protein [Dactylosporangium aurantiacum]UWZ50695.1 hypothetical protein Daura_28170 [Dactylosporangium aurantiacum]